MYGLVRRPSVTIRLNFSDKLKGITAAPERKGAEPTFHAVAASKDERAARTPYCLDVFDRSRIVPTLHPVPSDVPLLSRLVLAYYHLADASLDRVHDALMHSSTFDVPRLLYASWRQGFESAQVQRWVPALYHVKCMLQCIFEPHCVPQAHPWLLERGRAILDSLLCWMEPLEDLDMWNACGSESSFWQFWMMACWCIERFIYPHRDGSLSLNVCPLLWAHWNARVDLFSSLPEAMKVMQECRAIQRMEDYPFNRQYNVQLPPSLWMRPGTVIISACSGDLLLSMLNYTWQRSIECCMTHPEEWEWYLRSGQNVLMINAEMAEQEEWISCHPCRSTFYPPSPVVTMGEIESDDSDDDESSDSDSE